ncbi:tumor necrosis factor ligand superfamily member 11-like isoform X1 [Oncorhynchus nerka]|uniref:tumor necrosis factor ligand superfamily member 11-like isoform X1 n=1 Tax=Oncorhynchus nerka TaxID=8023 RepID=UPI001130FCB7|nr:tumor necrosis factor ligand superfamily member 11-like isoform X1 [Oncorhynchus nerka]
MAANDYRGYLRNHSDTESAQPRYHSSHGSEPTYRPLIFGTLAIMGFLQIASSVAILLHLTGYLQEVDISSAPQQPIEEVQTEPIIADALRDPRKGRQRCKNQGREGLPSAHLPIKVTIDYVKSKLIEVANKGELRAAMIHWDEAQGHLKKMRYHDGRLLVDESGLYYVYAKTCFRYYDLEPEMEPSDAPGHTLATPQTVDVNNAQLIQYISQEKHTSSPSKSVVLMKTGSTMRWNNSQYNMYCAQQGRGVMLQQGDGLFVNVSNAWMLDPEPEGTYFGAIKMGD